MKNKLEKITDLLLEGKISNEEAEDYIRKENLKLEDTPEIKENYNYKIIREKDHLRLIDEEGEEEAHIEFRKCLDKSGRDFFHLDHVRSHEHGKGHFRKIYDALENLAKKEDIPYLEAEVSMDNFFALAIYEHLGFKSVGYIKGDYEQLITMRKDLSDSE